MAVSSGAKPFLITMRHAVGSDGWAKILRAAVHRAKKSSIAGKLCFLPPAEVQVSDLGDADLKARIEWRRKQLQADEDELKRRRRASLAVTSIMVRFVMRLRIGARLRTSIARIFETDEQSRRLSLTVTRLSLSRLSLSRASLEGDRLSEGGRLSGVWAVMGRDGKCRRCLAPLAGPTST